jgi:hypothetical protein
MLMLLLLSLALCNVRTSVYRLPALLALSAFLCISHSLGGHSMHVLQPHRAAYLPYSKMADVRHLESLELVEVLPALSRCLLGFLLSYASLCKTSQMWIMHVTAVLIWLLCFPNFSPALGCR